MTLSRRRMQHGKKGRPLSAWQRPMKVLLAELNQLKDEQQALKYCLMSTGLLTQGDLARAAGPASEDAAAAPISDPERGATFQRLCRAPHVVRSLAQVLGSDVLHFASASRTASSACRSVLLMAEVPPVGLFSRLFSSSMQGASERTVESGGSGPARCTVPASTGTTGTTGTTMKVPSRGLSRLFGKLWRTEDDKSCVVSEVMQLREVLRSIGQTAGATAAFELCEACRACNEALRPILPLISQEAPHIYVSGGSSGIAMDSAERFNPRTGQWETLPSMCIPRRAGATASIGGRFYVLGGVDVPRFMGMDLPWSYEDKYRPECFDPVQNRFIVSLYPIDGLFMFIIPNVYSGSAKTMRCPGSPAWVHASMEVEVTARTSCRRVVDEIRARLDPKNGWRDPHNGGPLSLQGREPKFNHTMMTFSFSGNGATCSIYGCSESQVFSILDFSTNYCNLRNLYCGSEEGCKPVRYDFITEEVKVTPSLGAGEDKSACIVVTTTGGESMWELLPAMNRPYTHAAAAALGGHVYVFGGLSFGHVLDQAQRYSHGQWECLDPMPTPRFECTATATNGRIYVVGGSNICGEALCCMESYEASSGQWRQLPDMRQARYGCAAAALRGRVFVFGGHGHWENLCDAECYDAELDRWFPLQAMAEPRSHCGRKAGDEHFVGLCELAIVEAAAYHDDGSRMGHLLFQLGRADPLNSDADEGKTWGGSMLAIEDPYYLWWFEQNYGKIEDRGEIFVHFCKKPEQECGFHGRYGGLIHVDVFRVVTPDEAERTRWCSVEMKAKMKGLMRFAEADPPITVPGPPGDVQPGAAGVTGLRQALEGTPPGGGGTRRPEGEAEDKEELERVAKKKQKKRDAPEEDGSEDSTGRKDYGKVLQKRKPLSQAESALKLRETKKKKKRKKKREQKAMGRKSTSSSDDSSKDSSDGSVFHMAPLREGIERLKKTHLKRPGRLADLTLQRYRELLLRSTGRGAEEMEEVLPSVGRAYLQQVYFVQHPMQTLGQRTSREMKTLMLVVDYKNMVPSALDVLLQRQKALENWQQANLLELVDMEEARSYFTQELKAAQSQLKSDQKLQGKGAWRPYRPAAPWRPSSQDDTGKAVKESQEGDSAPPNVESKKGKKGKKGRGKGRW
eukprot:s548_g26.t3